MTLQKSLKYKNVSPFAFRNALRPGILPFLAYLAFMTFIFPFLNFINLQDQFFSIKLNNFYIDKVSHLNQVYIYSIFNDADDSAIFVTAATLIASLLMGICLFRFITSKKTVNVYYSLGIKRTNLFLSRYCAGLVLLFAAIAIPVAVSCIINVFFIGYTAQMLTSALYIVFSIFSLAMLTYSVTAAVMAVVGTVLEGVGFTAMIMLIPTGFFYMIELMAQTLLYGSPFLSGYYYDYTRNSVDVGLVMRYGKFNPITYLCKIIDDDCIGQLRVSDIEIYSESPLTQHLHPETAVIWLIIAVVITILAIALYNRRKAEICGFFGTCKVLNFAASFVTGIAAFTICIAWIYDRAKAASIISAAVLIILSYIIINLIFTRSFKKTFRSIYLVGAEYIAAIIVFTIFATGGFGYSSRLPKATEIRSASVSTVAFETALTQDECDAWSYYGSEEYSAFNHTTDEAVLGPYTSFDDIQKVLNLHSKLIRLKSENKENLYNSEIVIHYVLNDGSSMFRYYNYADLEAFKLNLELYETDFFKEALYNNYILNEVEDGVIIDIYFVDMLYENTKTIAVNSAVKTDSFSYMDLTEEQFTQLKKAVVNDLTALSSEQYYTPEKPATGAIVFKSTESLKKYIDGENQVEIKEEELVEYVFNPNTACGESTVFLTPDMVETLAFLEQNGLMGYFTATSADEVESISFLPAVLDKSSANYSRGVAFSLDFYAENEITWYHDKDVLYYQKAHQNTITDKDKINEILQKAHLRYYTGNEGYICRIKYTNGESVRKYITQEDAPDFVRNYKYLIAEDEVHSGIYIDTPIIGGSETAEVIAVD